jgi:pilus assembly protein CpaE
MSEQEGSARPRLNIGLIIANQDLWNEVQSSLRALPVEVVFQDSAPGEWRQLAERLERLSPHALLLDISGLRDFESTIRAIRSCASPPVVIALNRDANPETILAAVRAGAGEYLYPPLDAGLRRALERVSGEQFARNTRSHQQRARAIGFLSAKGGCGATTVACHVAVELGQLAQNGVVLADFDLDTGMVGFLMKVKTEYSIADAAENIHRLDMSYWKALTSNGRRNLEVIPAPGAGVMRASPDPEPFRRVLSFMRSSYDWVVTDLGRSLTSLSRGLLDDLDEVFLLCTLDVPALHQAKQVTRRLLEEGFQQDRLRLILNRMPKKSDFGMDEIQKILGLPVYTTLPSDEAELFEAYARGGLLPPNSELGQQLCRLATKIAGVEPQKGKSRLSLMF